MVTYMRLDTPYAHPRAMERHTASKCRPLMKREPLSNAECGMRNAEFYPERDEEDVTLSTTKGPKTQNYLLRTTTNRVAVEHE